MCNKLILFSIVALVISCNDSGLDGFGPQVVTGKVFDVFKGDTLFNENVEVSVNGNSFYTNSDGEFQIPDITTGNHLFAVKSEHHLPSDTVITIGKETGTLVSIQLKQKLLDFFPMGENIELKYKGESSSLSWDPTGADPIDVGTKKSYESITKTSFLDETDSSFRYHLETTNEGFVVNYESKNSVIQNSDTTNMYSRYLYVVSEDKYTSELSFDLIHRPSIDFGSSGPFYNRSSVVYWRSNGDQFYGWFRDRYLPQSRLTGNQAYNQLHIDGGLYTVKADTGLTNYQESYNGHTGKGTTQISLISFKN